MDLNLNSSWLSCAKYEFELGLVAMCAMWTWIWVDCNVQKTYITQMPFGWNLKVMKFSQWQTNVFYFVVQFTNSQGRNK
jgi:hypothetical protein